MILRYIYTIFLGILLATFVGVGIAAFYEAPVPPEYPTRLKFPPYEGSVGTPSAQTIREQEAFDQRQKDFQKENENYNKNVSMIALIAAVIVLGVSLLFSAKILFLSDGLLLGSLLTLIYSIIRGFSAGDDKFRFLVVAVGLVIAVAIGYMKFVKPSVKPKS